MTKLIRQLGKLASAVKCASRSPGLKSDHGSASLGENSPVIGSAASEPLARLDSGRLRRLDVARLHRRLQILGAGERDADANGL